MNEIPLILPKHIERIESLRRHSLYLSAHSSVNIYIINHEFYFVEHHPTHFPYKPDKVQVHNSSFLGNFVSKKGPLCLLPIAKDFIFLSILVNGTNAENANVIRGTEIISTEEAFDKLASMLKDRMDNRQVDQSFYSKWKIESKDRWREPKLINLLLDMLQCLLNDASIKLLYKHFNLKSPNIELPKVEKKKRGSQPAKENMKGQNTITKYFSVK